MIKNDKKWVSRGAMSKAYDFAKVEGPVYEFWSDNEYFKPITDKNAEPFTVIMPPPNVTGSLHLGHALESSIQDALVRWKRMKGYAALWLPGTDHAGIATQVVVERELFTNKGKTRQEIGRNEFIKHIWEWVRLYGNVIHEQRRRLGCSCDWDRSVFTLDPEPSVAVRRTFVELYKKGLIYRGRRLVNWCARCQTAISDLEVVHTEQIGTIYKIKYPFYEEDEHLLIATTRPETILGDTAVAVHPDDERYKTFIGKFMRVPFTNRKIPIIADKTVDPDFGTGALKVTPAHDPVDFEIGERHELESVSVIGFDGKMTDEAGQFSGMDRQAAKDEIVKQLTSEGLLVSTEEHPHSIGHCDRCNTVVEPLVSLQWWVAMSRMKAASVDAVRSGKIEFVPERFTRVYFNWMENLRDWCVSRQLWWGHRIPVWYCDVCHDTIVEEETPSHCKSCGSNDLTQDQDVLDTWFSSGLWPHSTLGWPNKDAPDMQRFYPTQVMECGRDILFLWVSRMITLSLENTGKVPFSTVYLHGLLQDPDGSKMSKVKGNVVDPLELIDTYGTDAVRFALTTGVSPGNESRLSHAKMEAGRNFANKLWNAARFVVATMDGTDKPTDWGLSNEPVHLEDRWIVSRLNKLVANVENALSSYQIGDAQRQIYEFVWSEFCDWYIELSKVRINQSKDQTPVIFLATTLETVLRLLHPFMPFVSEEIWQHLKSAFGRSGCAIEVESLMISKFPEPSKNRYDKQAENDMDVLISIVRGVRNVRAELRIPQRDQINFSIYSENNSKIIQNEIVAIEHLARSKNTGVSLELKKIENAVTIVLGGATIMVELPNISDFSEITARLELDLSKAISAQRELTSRLENKRFVEKAPYEVVEKERERLFETDHRIARLRQLLGVNI